MAKMPFDVLSHLRSSMRVEPSQVLDGLRGQKDLVAQYGQIVARFARPIKDRVCGSSKENDKSRTSEPGTGMTRWRRSVLGFGTPNPNFGEPFRKGRAELGYVEGQNILIEWRGDEGRAERLAHNVAELVNLNLDLVVATGDNRARAIRQATSTLPIVMSPGVDPVGAGLIESFGRPGVRSRLNKNTPRAYGGRGPA